MAKTVLKFGKTRFTIVVPAGVAPEEVTQFAHQAIEHAADKARLEGRTLRALEVLQALRRAMTSRWVGVQVEMES